MQLLILIQFLFISSLSNQISRANGKAIALNENTTTTLPDNTSSSSSSSSSTTTTTTTTITPPTVISTSPEQTNSSFQVQQQEQQASSSTKPAPVTNSTLDNSINNNSSSSTPTPTSIVLQQQDITQIPKNQTTTTQTNDESTNINNYDNSTKTISTTTSAPESEFNLKLRFSDKQQILSMFNKFFVKPRSHDDQQQKEFVRDGVVMRLKELGFETSFLQKSRFEFRKAQAFSYNMISILPGKFRHTKDEKIVLVGAHWDSATKAPGVDDNGSGSVCLLEIARILSENKCKLNNTIMLVWFDYEEQGKFGSEFFVNDYLFPLELDKYNSQFIGAYIMDMILVRDKENFSQQIPASLSSKLPEFVEEMEEDKYRGNFLATWARQSHDQLLESNFRSAWTDLGFENRSFKAMRPKLPKTKLPTSTDKVQWSDFFRSDHASFWYPALTTKTVARAPNRTSTIGHTSLSAILLTDLGPWRKSYTLCYHSPCDDSHFLTDNNLAFMQQVVDTLVLTLIRSAEGTCNNNLSAKLMATKVG